MNESLTLFTIGAFGFSESAFFDTLKRAQIDLFCDIRRRRGVRGAEYAFVNSARLQRSLGEIGIAYSHILQLAPPEHVRAVQAKVDKASGKPRRSRSELSPEFIEAYKAVCLADFDSRAFVESFQPEPERIAIFCVEHDPSACHRSLVAERISDDLGIPVIHLLP